MDIRAIMILQVSIFRILWAIESNSAVPNQMPQLRTFGYLRNSPLSLIGHRRSTGWLAEHEERPLTDVQYVFAVSLMRVIISLMLFRLIRLILKRFLQQERSASYTSLGVRQVRRGCAFLGRIHACLGMFLRKADHISGTGWYSESLWTSMWRKQFYLCSAIVPGKQDKGVSLKWLDPDTCKAEPSRRGEKLRFLGNGDKVRSVSVPDPIQDWYFDLLLTFDLPRSAVLHTVSTFTPHSDATVQNEDISFAQGSAAPPHEPSPQLTSVSVV